MMMSKESELVEWEIVNDNDINESNPLILNATPIIIHPSIENNNNSKITEKKNTNNINNNYDYVMKVEDVVEGIETDILLDNDLNKSENFLNEIKLDSSRKCANPYNNIPIPETLDPGTTRKALANQIAKRRAEEDALLLKQSVKKGQQDVKLEKLNVQKANKKAEELSQNYQSSNNILLKEMNNILNNNDIILKEKKDNKKEDITSISSSITNNKLKKEGYSVSSYKSIYDTSGGYKMESETKGYNFTTENWKPNSYKSIYDTK